MIVERCTFPVKIGTEQDAVTVIKKTMELVGACEAYRLYTPSIGPMCTVSLETEYKDWEQRQEWWAKLPGIPGFDRILKEWQSVRDGGGTREIWNLAE